MEGTGFLFWVSGFLSQILVQVCSLACCLTLGKSPELSDPHLPQLPDTTWGWQRWQCAEHQEQSWRRDDPLPIPLESNGGKARADPSAGTRQLNQLFHFLSSAPGGLFTFRDTAQSDQTSQPQPFFALYGCISLPVALNTQSNSNEKLLAKLRPNGKSGCV